MSTTLTIEASTIVLPKITQTFKDCIFELLEDRDFCENIYLEFEGSYWRVEELYDMLHEGEDHVLQNAAAEIATYGVRDLSNSNKYFCRFVKRKFALQAMREQYL